MPVPQRRLHDAEISGPLAQPRREGMPQRVHRHRAHDPEVYARASDADVRRALTPQGRTLHT